jgi:DNA-binding response OmpR family regulator
VSKKILVVDDEVHLTEMVKMRLEAAGYSVSCAYDGQDGLEKAKKEKPDLIILDLMLPKMDGYKVCGLLKNDARYSKIPIVMFSARVQDNDVILGRELGAEAYVTKPFEPKVLPDKIKELLGE